MKPGNLCIARCQIRRQTKDEDLIRIFTHIRSSGVRFLFIVERKNKNGKKTLYL